MAPARGAPLEYQRTIRPDPERVLAESGKGFCREKDPKTSPAFMKLDRGSNEVAFADSIRSARREMKTRKRLRAFWLNSESKASRRGLKFEQIGVAKISWKEVAFADSIRSAKRGAV